MNTSWENWAFHYSQGCQRKIEAAQKQAKFILQDQNEEVLAINSLLRRQIDELQRENEAYKQELMLRDQRSVVTRGDEDLEELPKDKPSVKRKVSVAENKTAASTSVAKVGLKRAKGRKRGNGKQVE